LADRLQVFARLQPALEHVAERARERAVHRVHVVADLCGRGGVELVETGAHGGRKLGLPRGWRRARRLHRDAWRTGNRTARERNEITARRAERFGRTEG